MINAAGAVYDVDHGTGAVHRGADRWSIEMRLPVVGAEAFVLDPTKGIDGERPKELFPWHFNLGRSRVRNGQPERTAYSPTGTNDFHVPEKFAKRGGGDISL